MKNLSMHIKVKKVCLTLQVRKEIPDIEFFYCPIMQL